MDAPNQQLQDLHDIKQMMERSSRFITLSGLSGISAGLCALAGVFFAHGTLKNTGDLPLVITEQSNSSAIPQLTYLENRMLIIALLTFVSAFILAFVFTYLRSRKNNVAIWGTAARRLVLGVGLPMLAGGVFLFRMMQYQVYEFIAPGCLLFYGLALVNASKYTLGEIKYLGYTVVLVGLVACLFMEYGLYFWAFGFGVLHILYGAVMWNKHERNTSAVDA